MGSINRSHNEADGGVLLFQGELILLYCDSVNCEIGGKESFKGRVYLTTHRLVIIVSPYKQNAPVKSLCAPFCSITRCNVEQPIFGANYIEATVRDEADPTKSFSFKLRFSKGGAIELAMAMNRAVVAVGRGFNPTMPPPPAYTPAPSAQYYQAPPTVYAPGYNAGGIQMPVHQFPDQPPIGFIYTSSAPPPYPGLNTGSGGSAGGQPAQQQQQHPAPPPYQAPGQAGGYPGGSSGGYPQQQPPPQGGGYPQSQGGGYPQAQGGYPQAQGGYPQSQGGYPQAQGGYPQTQGGGYPSGGPAPQSNPAGYPQSSAQNTGGYPQPASDGASAGYPNLSQQQQPSGGQSAWPSAPSFNPVWSDTKKSD